jgi:predicted nucleic acid-binding protein
VANAPWRLHRAGQLEADSLQRRLSKAAELVDHIEPDRRLPAEALALATHLDHPVYDRLYLVLARREAATPPSADQKLLDLAGKVLP